MIKKILLICALFVNASCKELIKNDYSYIKNIDKEFFYKVGDQEEYIYIIKNKNGSLIKQELIEIPKKYDVEGQDSAWKILNYDNKKLYVSHQNNYGVGEDYRISKVYYYNENYELMEFNKNYSNENAYIKFVINDSVYSRDNDTLYKNSEIKYNDKYVKYITYELNPKRIEMSVYDKKDEKEKTVNYYINEDRVEEENEKNSKLFLDDENIILAKKKILKKKNLKTKKEKVIYKAYGDIGRMMFLDKEKRFLYFFVVSSRDKILRGENDFDHAIVYDLKEDKKYLVEVNFKDLVEQNEQLKLMSEIIHGGIEKVE